MEINQKLIQDLTDQITALRSELKGAEERITTTEFCRRHSITRHTLYRWKNRGLIKTEVICGKHYVILNSDNRKKYQRDLVTA